MMVTSSVFEESRLEWGAEKKVDWGGEIQFAGYSCRGPCLELLPVFLSGGWAVLTDDHRGAFSAQWFGIALKFNMQVRNDKHPTVPESGLPREERSFFKRYFYSCWNEEWEKAWGKLGRVLGGNQIYLYYVLFIWSQCASVCMWGEREGEILRVLCYIEKIIEFSHTCWHWWDQLMMWKLLMMNCSFNALPEFICYHLKMCTSLFINAICLWFFFFWIIFIVWTW